MHIFNITFLLFGICLSKHVVAISKSPRNLEIDPDIQDMDTRYPNPFAAFWQQGLVPGEGFPQIGMSAYGYGLPGLGLSPFLTPDALILAGVGKGEISEDDLKHAEEEMYNFDWLKGNDKKHGQYHHNKDGGYDDTEDYDGNGPDPDYPGCFKGEDCDQVGDDADDHHNNYHHHYHDNGGGTSVLPSKKLFSAIAMAATALIS